MTISERVSDSTCYNSVELVISDQVTTDEGVVLHLQALIDFLVL
jgi:hypothetical protein